MAAIVARRALGAGVVALSAIALLSRSENVVSRALSADAASLHSRDLSTDAFYVKK